MLDVKICISECRTANLEARDPSGLRYLMIHRFGWVTSQEFDERGISADGIGVSRYYRKNQEASAATNGQMPYTFVIDRRGTIWQCAKIGVATPHGRRFNIIGLGVAVLGDFRIVPPTDAQLQSLQTLCSAVTRLWKLEIVGHSELVGAASPGKVCPGPCLDMDELKDRVEAINLREAGAELVDAGAVF